MNDRDIPSPDIRLLDMVRIGPPTEDHRRDNPLSGQRTQVLAARLLMDRRRPASCDELAEVIWGEKLPKTWHAALCTARRR